MENENINDLLPPYSYWSGFEINTEEKLIFLGSSTISWMISYWMDKSKEYEIERDEARIRGKSFNKNATSRMLFKNAFMKFSDRIKETARIKETLESFKTKAELAEGKDKKPLLPICRPFDYFISGERINYFIGGQWVEVEIYNGHEKEEMYAFVIVGSTPIPKRHPKIVKLSEFEFLKKHLDFAQLWVKIVLLFNEETNPETNPEIMLKALKAN